MSLEINTAYVRRPGPRLADGELTHLERTPIDFELACRQWHDYVEVFVNDGWDIVEVDPADDCPDAVFVEDAVVLFGDLAVIANPGAKSRQPEIDAVERLMEERGHPVIRLADVDPSARLDGGDVLKVGSIVYVGLSGRTNQRGIDAMASVIGSAGYRAVAIPINKVLHLKSAVTALPDGRIIGYEPLTDDPSAFPDYLAVPEESGAHVVHLADGGLLVAGQCPESAQMFRELEYRVIEVDISEFERLEGCVTCLSVRHRSH